MSLSAVQSQSRKWGFGADVALLLKARAMTRKLNIKPIREQKEKGIFGNKLPIEEIRKFWNDDDIKYTDEELLKMGDWFYCLAEVVLNIYYHPRYEKLIEEFKTWRNERKESDIICESEYRRAS